VVADLAVTRAVRVHASLPIFRLSVDDEVVFYAPGHALLVPAEKAGQIEAATASGVGCENFEAAALARLLEAHGRAASQAWRDLAARPFEPECLTLVLSNRCDLACCYCYAAVGRDEPAGAHTMAGSAPVAPPPRGRPLRTLPEPAAEQAARLVARRCASASRPLIVVFHGGGEPTFEWELLVRLRAMVSRVARDHGIPAWVYLATHGAIDESRARWLAQHIDHVGLSCDGPPDIQDAQRRAPSATTSALVERTARILTDAGAEITVRVTVTPATVNRQSEIVDYLRGRLGARRIRFEPVYRGRGAGGRHFLPEDADEFVKHYIRAAEAARAHGCELHTSGARPGDIHGPYCNPLRNVVQVGPDGSVSACFLDAGSRAPGDARLELGRMGTQSGELKIDGRRAAELRRNAAAIPAHCEACVNIYHCARGCPEVCLATAVDRSGGQEGFRCRVQRGLAIWRIRQMARGQVH